MTTPAWTPPPRVRPIAIALIRDEGRLLVMEGSHVGAERPYYRPLGGTIEFGERGEATVRRELREELGFKIGAVHYLGALENHYVIERHRGHEIVLVYETELVPGTPIRETYAVTEGGLLAFHAVWIPIDDFVTGRAWLVPEGLTSYLVRAR